MRSERKPLWGFGWAGWVLLGVFFAVLGSHLAGIDLQLRFLHLIDRVAGADAVLWFVGLVQPAHAFMMPGYGMPVPEPAFGIPLMLVVLVAFHVSARRIPWWWCVLIITGAFALPPLEWVMFRWTGLSYMTQLVLGRITSSVLGAALLLGATRSWLIGATVGGLIVAWAAMISFAPELLSWPVALLWNIVFLGALFTWAIRARMRCIPPGHCPVCGYHLAGLADGAPCPECGGGAQSDSTGGRVAPGENPGCAPSS